MNKSVGKILHHFFNSGQKGIAWLVDPEKDMDLSSMNWVRNSGLDLVLLGGSTKEPFQLNEIIPQLRKAVGQIPICIFPGSHLQVCSQADALMFLSLLSGRNPEYLIGQQVKSALEVANSGLEVLPTAYILVNEGEILSVHAISQTLPLLNSQPNLVVQTALAGKFLGMEYFFLDAGSGASHPVSPTVIGAIKNTIQAPLIVGGGLDSTAKVKAAFEAGADLLVLGNVIEKDPDFLAEVLDTKRWYNHSLNIN